MNAFSNIWQHPKTSAAGLLLGVITIAQVLLGQGVSLGHVGTGTGVTLIVGVATAILGLISRDPEKASSADLSSTSRVGVWALIMLLLTAPFATGCTGTQIAQDIVNWTPALQSTAATVASTVALLQPQDALIIAGALAGFDAATNLGVAEARAYLANPGQTTLQALQTAIVTLQQQVNSGLLAAVKVVNPNSQAALTAALNAVATVVNSIFALILQIKGNTLSATPVPVVASMREVSPYLDREQAASIVADHYRIPRWFARAEVDRSLEQIAQAGF